MQFQNSWNSESTKLGFEDKVLRDLYMSRRKLGCVWSPSCREAKSGPTAAAPLEAPVQYYILIEALAHTIIRCKVHHPLLPIEPCWSYSLCRADRWVDCLWEAPEAQYRNCIHLPSQWLCLCPCTLQKLPTKCFDHTQKKEVKNPNGSNNLSQKKTIPIMLRKIYKQWISNFLYLVVSIQVFLQ